MSPNDILLAASAVAAYGISSIIQVELRDGRRMTAVGAFGPGLVALGASGYHVAPLIALIGAALTAEIIALVVARNSVRVVMAHTLSLAFAAGVFGLVSDHSGVAGRGGLLIATAACSLVYFLAELLRSAARRDSLRGARIWDRLAEAAPVHTVLLSTAGLTVLALPLLRWATFPIVLVPLLAAAHEFANFGKTKRTFDETVRALASLVEGAGYAPDGHHQRVAALCVAVGRRLGLSSKQIRELELVALLHDVGAVSFPDPDHVARAGRLVVAERSAEFVEETGYLAGHGQTLREAARDQINDVEASILRVANAYDEWQESESELSRSLESTLATLPSSVAQAFRDVIAAGQRRTD